MKNENNLPGIFTGIAPTKADIIEQCQVIIDNINEGGDVNPLRVATSMKAVELAMQTIKAGISSAILDEASKYDTKTFEFDGHSVGVREGGIKYDYSLCCDPALAKLESTAKFTADSIKERQAFLKTIKDQMTIVDDESGEVFTVLPPTKSSITTYSITLNKKS